MKLQIARWLDLIAPRRCLGCDAVNEEPWCASCGPPCDAPSDQPLSGIPVVALGTYEGPLARAVRRFKYDPRPELATRFAEELAKKARAIALEPGCALVPIPLFSKRLVERGFNQSALLANALARALGRAHSPRLLERTRETGRQAALDRHERTANVEGVFALRGRAPLQAMLVDDVVTTGATALSCVRVLTEQEVNVVAIATIARTPGRSRIS